MSALRHKPITAAISRADSVPLAACPDPTGARPLWRITMTIIEHRLTWRGFVPVHVKAATKQEAVRIAVERRPAFIPRGTELHYGTVCSSRTALAVAI